MNDKVNGKDDPYRSGQPPGYGALRRDERQACPARENAEFLEVKKQKEKE